MCIWINDVNAFGLSSTV